MIPAAPVPTIEAVQEFRLLERATLLGCLVMIWPNEKARLCVYGRR
jgi:hypothetical protein